MLIGIQNTGIDKYIHFKMFLCKVLISSILCQHYMRRILLALLIAAQFVAAPAMAPTAWQVGDSWAVGNEIDFSWVFDELTAELRTELDDNVGDSDFPVKSYTYDNEGNLGLYYRAEVVDDFDAQYHVASETGFYTHVSTEWEMQIEQPEAGHYEDVEERCGDGDGENESDEGGCRYYFANGDPVPLVEQPVSLFFSVDQVERFNTDSWWTVDEYDLTKLDLVLSQGTEFEFSLMNVPNLTDSNNGVDIRYESLSWGGSTEVSLHLLLEFGEPMNVLDLPIEEDEIWGGSTTVTISGDLGGEINLDKPVSSACPESDCDLLPELQELYQNLTEGFAEMDVDRSFSSWEDLFPLHVPSNWMQELLDAALDEMEAEERDAYDESGVNLRIEGNRFHFGPVEIPETVHYNFTTGNRLEVPLEDGTTVEAFEVVPYESEEQHDDSDDEPFDDGGRGGHGENEQMEPESPFEDIDFHSYTAADTGRLAYVHVDVPVPMSEDSTISLEAESVGSAEAEIALMEKADPANPQRNGPAPEQFDSGFSIPGVGLLAALPLAIAARKRRR